jgi:hypothetical protein
MLIILNISREIYLSGNKITSIHMACEGYELKVCGIHNYHWAITSSVVFLELEDPVTFDFSLGSCARSAGRSDERGPGVSATQSHTCVPTARK